MNPTDHSWMLLARRTASRVGICEALHQAAPCVVIAGVISLILGITGRHLAWSFAGTAALLSASTFPVLALALIIARRRREIMDPVRGIVRLDMILGLNNALTAARAGHGPWPELPSTSDDRLRVNWQRILTPFVICFGLAATGVLLPLPGDPVASADMPRPRSHDEIAAAIVELDKLGTVRKEDIAQLEKRLEEITAQPPGEWYSHSSLEAADHLLAGLQEQLQSMAQNLSRARSSLGALDVGAESMSVAEHQRLAGEFKSALEGLKNGAPGLNEKLMSALSKVDPSNLKSMSRSDLENMLAGMKSAERACRNCSGKGESTGSDARKELSDLLGDGWNPQAGNGQRDETGRGGVQRGPGVAPLPLSSNPTDLATQNPESLAATDLSRTRPGDLIGTANTEHQLDKSAFGPRSGGAAASSGQGGDAVWRDTLMPQEKAVLRDYFK